VRASVSVSVSEFNSLMNNAKVLEGVSREVLQLLLPGRVRGPEDLDAVQCFLIEEQRHDLPDGKEHQRRVHDETSAQDLRVEGLCHACHWVYMG
jgi:hypothetical protein